MPRPLRVEYEGATYHVMCRGNRRATIFKSNADVELWLQTLGEACERSQLVIHAYCVMGTHYHLLLETPKGNLVEGMKWLQGTFTQRYNSVHNEWGHLFQGRYKAKVVDTDPSYFATAGLYILLNPVDAGMIDLRRKDLGEYKWSSYPAQSGRPSRRPDWLVTERLMNSFGIGPDSIAGRRAFSSYVKARGLALQLDRLDKAAAKEWRMMERGWIHGGIEFRNRMIELLEQTGRAPAAEAGDQSRDISQRAAHRALKKGMEVLNLVGYDLAELKKGDERKLLLAGWLRSYFPVSTKWCAEELHMGHVSTNSRAWKFYQNPPQKKWRMLKQELIGII